MPKIGNFFVKFWGVQNLKGDHNILTIYTCSTINMHTFIKIGLGILIQCHRNYMEMKKFNYMLEIDILRNS